MSEAPVDDDLMELSTTVDRVVRALEDGKIPPIQRTEEIKSVYLSGIMNAIIHLTQAMRDLSDSGWQKN